ncbi:MAG: hypothetical protein NT139_01855 [Candidatus Woesearchaeota archaeon]|nr:hypothetical protein [Candidatus Woesearchaeota archaeon]
MNKRGQVYLLVAIILCFVIYLLVVERNISVEKVVEDDFKELSSNYEVESSKFVNILLLSNERDVSDSFINFSILYSSYARAQNPYFGLIYAFYNNDVLYMGNYMDQPIMVDYQQGVIGLNGCYNDLSATIDFAGFSISPGLKNTVLQKTCIANVSAKGLSDVSIILNGGYYTFGLSTNKPEIIIVSRESLEGVSKVYVGGEFKKEISGPKEKYLCAGETTKANCERLGCLWTGSSCVLSCSYYKDKNECSNDANCCWDATSGIISMLYLGICRDKGKCLTTCSGGTAIGQCSSTKPKFCSLVQNNLQLVDNCILCGCSSGYTCQSSTGACVVQSQQCQNCKTSPCNYYNDCVAGTGTCTTGYCCSGTCTIPQQTCSSLGGTCELGYCSYYNSCNPIDGATDCGYGYSCCSGTCTIPQQTCSSLGGTCKSNTCSSYISCSSVSGATDCSNCCSGSCTTPCTPSWSCTSWGACVGGQQTRTCTDSNNCGTTIYKPGETQNCVQLKKLKCTQDYVKLNWCTSRSCSIYACASFINQCSPDTCVEIKEESGCGRDNLCQLWCKSTVYSECSVTPTCPSGYTQEGGLLDC